MRRSCRTLLGCADFSVPIFGYQWRDQALLTKVLSDRDEAQRLEFLGDALLDSALSLILMNRWPDTREGKLTEARALLVSGKNLESIGIRENLRLHLPANRDWNLSDLVEMLLATIYLDGGWDALLEVVAELFAEQLDGMTPTDNFTHPKSDLQQILMGRSWPTPVYEYLGIVEGQHRALCHLSIGSRQENQAFKGSGSNRRQAETKAAQRALAWLNKTL